MGSQAVFVPRNSGQSASGKALSANYGDNLISWRLSPVLNRFRYKRAKVRWYDPKEAKYKTKEIDIGDANAAVDLVDTQKAADEDRAKDKATSRAEESSAARAGGR